MPGATDTLTLRVEARRDGDGAPAPGGRGDRHPQAAVRAHLATIGHVESADTRRVYGAVLQRFAGRTGPAKPERLCARAVLVPMAMFCPDCQQNLDDVLVQSQYGAAVVL
jgi:hypothetical protein